MLGCLNGYIVNIKKKIMKNDITEDYCSFEVSKLLKEKGFDIPCENFYCKSEKVSLECYDPFPYNSELSEGCCSIPTHALAIKWIRENFGIHIWLENNAFGYIWKTNNASELPWEGDKRNNLHMEIDKEHKKPEEAVEAALLYILKNLIK